MKMDTVDSRAESRRREALPSDVRVFVETHLRELARSGRLSDLARSRNELKKYYRAQRNEAAAYLLASAPDFCLAITPGGGVMLTLTGKADHATWEHSDLLQDEQDEVNGVEHLAVEFAGGPDQFHALNEEEQEALIAQAVEETFRRLRGR